MRSRVPVVFSTVAVVVGSVLALSLGACAETPAKKAEFLGPIVLITFDGLRFDPFDRPDHGAKIAPHLAAFFAHADWLGRGIAASGDGDAALASVLTGLRPSQHGAFGGAALAPQVSTLAEALSPRGYRASGFAPARTVRIGLARGFGEFADLGKDRPAAAKLAHLGSGRSFVWVHIPEPRSPFVRRDWLLGRLEHPPEKLPHRLSSAQVDAWLATGAAREPHRHATLRAMYELNLAWGDERFGRLLAALERSGQRSRTLLIVGGVRGDDFAEGGASGRDGGLGRTAIETPFAIDFPEGLVRRPAASSGSRVGVARLFATVLEAAGGAIPPAVSPSLFRDDPRPILSELLGGAGGDRFSLLARDRQLLSAVDPRSKAPSRDEIRSWGPSGSQSLDDPALAETLRANLAALQASFPPETSSETSPESSKGDPEGGRPR